MHEHDENCNHDEEIIEVVTLEIDGETKDFAILSIFTVEEKDYIALTAIDDDSNDEDEESILLCNFKELDNDEIEISQIEGAQEEEKVWAVFDEILAEEINSIDEIDEEQ